MSLQTKVEAALAKIAARHATQALDTPAEVIPSASTAKASKTKPVKAVQSAHACSVCCMAWSISFVHGGAWTMCGPCAEILVVQPAVTAATLAQRSRRKKLCPPCVFPHLSPLPPSYRMPSSPPRPHGWAGPGRCFPGSKQRSKRRRREAQDVHVQAFVRRHVRHEQRLKRTLCRDVQRHREGVCVHELLRGAPGWRCGLGWLTVAHGGGEAVCKRV